jgi:hypothetical protein
MFHVGLHCLIGGPALECCAGWIMRRGTPASGYSIHCSVLKTMTRSVPVIFGGSDPQAASFNSQVRLSSPVPAVFHTSILLANPPCQNPMLPATRVGGSPRPLPTKRRFQPGSHNRGNATMCPDMHLRALSWCVVPQLGISVSAVESPAPRR